MVYFIQSTTGPIKIGSTNQIHKRLNSIQTSCPDKLNIICTMPGSKKLEKSLHKEFAVYRLRDEWFDCNKFILMFIENYHRNPQTNPLP